MLLWWLYFDFHAEHTVRRFKAMPTEQGKLGRDLSYLSIPLVAGIIVCAVANELVIAHPEEQLGTQGWSRSAPVPSSTCSEAWRSRSASSGRCGSRARSPPP